jgi:hypothetical protein
LTGWGFPVKRFASPARNDLLVKLRPDSVLPEEEEQEMPGRKKPTGKNPKSLPEKAREAFLTSKGVQSSSLATQSL